MTKTRVQVKGANLAYLLGPSFAWAILKKMGMVERVFPPQAKLKTQSHMAVITSTGVPKIMQKQPLTYVYIKGRR